jgi:hypothetical protein
MEWLTRRMQGPPAHHALVPEKTLYVEVELKGPHDPALTQRLHALHVEPGQDPEEVYRRLLEVGTEHYLSIRSLPPATFNKAVLSAMFTAPWTNDAYMEFVLDVFE